MELLLSAVVVQHTRDGGAGVAFGSLTPCQPCSRVLGQQEGPRAPGRSSRAAPAGQGWAALPVSHGQHSPAAWAAPKTKGWRDKSLSHPSVPTLELCFSSPLTSTVFRVCKVRGGAGQEPKAQQYLRLCHVAEEL